MVWGYVFGVFVVSTAWSYTSIYKTQAERDALAHAFGTNQATIALFGPAPELQTTGGFTILKVSMTLMIIGAVWGLLTGTRLLRGEEEAGRWDLMLVGRTTPRRATADALAGLGAGAGALWAVTAVITVLAGLSPRIGISVGSALYLALALVAPALVFLAVGSVTSQVAPTRRTAAGYGALVLGISYALRMVGDAGVGLHALTWLSPLGWVELLAPLTSADPVPLAPIFVCTIVLAAIAVVLSGHRDAGSGMISDRAHSAPRLGLLRGQLGLSVRLLWAVALGWLGAVVVVGLLFGLVARSAGTSLSGSSVRDVFDKLGAPGGGTAAYLGVAFLMLAALIGFTAAGQVSAARDEEAQGRLDVLVVHPLPRTRWLLGRLGIGVVLVVACGTVGALSTWFAAASQHSGFGVGPLLAAGLNAAVPALVVLGVGVLLVGVWPRVASPVLYALLAWSLVIELVGGIGAVSHWILDTSIFHHVSSAPAVPVDWVADATLVLCAGVATLVGTLCFARRDLRGA